MDFTEITKHFVQRMSSSCGFDFVPSKRATRYLGRKSKVTLRFRRQNYDDKITVFVSPERARRGVMTQIFNHIVKSGSTLQNLSALNFWRKRNFHVIVKNRVKFDYPWNLWIRILGISMMIEMQSNSSTANCFIGSSTANEAHWRAVLGDLSVKKMPTAKKCAYVGLAQGNIPMVIGNRWWWVKLTALQTARRSQGHCHWNHTLCRPGLGLIASVIYCVATEADPRVTIPSVDGIGTYDHILRSAMSGLTSMSGAKSMLPFVHIVRATFELPVVRWSKSCTCGDPKGENKTTTDAPPFFHWHPRCVGRYDNVVTAKRTVVLPSWTTCIGCATPAERFLFWLARDSIDKGRWHSVAPWENEGQQSKCHPRQHWDQRFGNLKTSRCLTSIDTKQYVSQKMEERLVEENTLWTTIPTVPDLQHFATSAPKRKTLKRTTHAHHAPKCFSCVCHSHDEGMWDTSIPCWMESPAANEAESQQLSTLPMRMGGLRSTATCAPVSCLAWWADALTWSISVHQMWPTTCCAD